MWKPAVTVAAVVERGGRFLLVEEHTAEGLRLNQPAGHLDPGETLLQAAAREALEETAHAFTPRELLGVYMARNEAAGVTYVRFAFTGELGAAVPGRALDDGIVGLHWLDIAELRASHARHRSPLVLRCAEDYLRGRRYPLELLWAHPSVLGA